MREQRNEYSANHEVALQGRRRKQDAANSLKFLADIEGVDTFDGHVRGANGLRWRVA